MAQTPGYEYDIFISYAHTDDARLSGEKGWVSLFHELLSNWLVKLRGQKDLKIWFDESRLGGNTLFDDAIKRGVESSALFFVIHSKNYQSSEYCKKELDWFLDYNHRNRNGINIGDDARLFVIQIENIHFDLWSPKLAGMSGFVMHDGGDNEFGIPISSADSRLFEKHMRKIVDQAGKTIDALRVSSNKPRSVYLEHKSDLPKVFLANVPDTLKSFRKQIVDEITDKANVLSDLPPPHHIQEHNRQLQLALNEASLSIHLLDQFSGTEIIGVSDGTTYPRAQANAAGSHKTRSLFWVPNSLNEDVSDEPEYATWLYELENGKRKSKEFEFIRSHKQAFLNQIHQELARKGSNQTSYHTSISPSYLIDTNPVDQLLAYQLAAKLVQYGTNQDVNFNKEPNLPDESYERYEEAIRRAQQIIIVVGDVSGQWARSRLETALKIVNQEVAEQNNPHKKIWALVLRSEENISRFPEFNEEKQLRYLYIDDISDINKDLVRRLQESSNIIFESNGVVSPFIGLRPFERSDSSLYFGRDTEVKKLLEILHKNKLITVVGSSGSGKSSLIRAGLIPQLEAGFLVQEYDQWQFVNSKPGDAPLDNLVDSLLNSIKPDKDQKEREKERNHLIAAIEEHGVSALLSVLNSHLTEYNLLILIDQFEELFRLGLTKGQSTRRQHAEQFVALLLSLSRQHLPVYICLTMRSDFLGDCDAFYGLPEAINQSHFLVPRLTRKQRQDVITKPINLAGAKIAPRLVDKLLNENIDSRDDLPILQHVLMRTWDVWQASGEGMLDITDYEKAHTIHYALDSHADEVLNELNNGQERIAKILFKALTTIDAGNRRIRRPAYLQDVAAIANTTPHALMEVINCFCEKGRSFLVLSSANENDNPLIDISHESLIRHWKTLGDWVDEEYDNAETYQRLVISTQRWKDSRGALLHGVELDLAEKWHKGITADGSAAIWAMQYDNSQANCTYFQVVTEYIRQSSTARVEKQVAEKTEQERLARLFKEKAELEEQKRILAEINAQEQKITLHRTRRILALLFVTTILFALGARLIYKQKMDLSLAQEGTERALEETRIANISVKQALEISKKNEKIAKAAEALARHNELESNYNLAKAFEEKSMLSITRGDSLVKDASSSSAATREYRSALLYALESQRRPLAEDKIAIKRASLARVSKMNSETLKTPLFTTPHLALRSILVIDYSPDGTVIASVSGGNFIRLWNAQTGETMGILEGHSLFETITYSPDGMVIASASRDGSIQLWNPKNGQRITTFKAHSTSVNTLVYSPDGATIASGGEDGTVRLWDSKTGEAINTLLGHSDAVKTLAYSPDGASIVSGSRDNTIRLWSAPTGETKNTFKGHLGAVKTVVFSPDGSIIASGSEDKTIRLWKLQTGGVIQTLKGHSGNVNAVVYSDDGKVIISGSNDKTIRLWSTQTGETIDTLNGHSGFVTTLAYSPNNSVIASGSRDRSIRLWNSQTGKPISSLMGHSNQVSSIAYSPKGEVFATGSYNGIIRVWNSKTGQTVNALHGHTGAVTEILFSEDGKTIATKSYDNIRFWNLQSGESIQMIKEYETSLQSLVQSSDGKFIASISLQLGFEHNKSNILVWDIQTGILVQSYDGQPNGIQISFDQNNDLMVTIAQGRIIRKLHLRSGEAVDVYEHHTKIDALVWQSPDGKQFAFTGRDNVLQLWDSNSRKIIPLPRIYYPSLSKIIFSQDGKALAVVSTSREITEVFDTKSGKVITTLVGNFSSIALSPDNKFIASSSSEGGIKIWHTEHSKNVEVTFKEGSSHVTAVAFSPNDKYIASAAGGQIQLWDLQSGRLTQNITASRAAEHIFSLKFSNDGETILAGSFNNEVFRWDTQTGRLINTFIGKESHEVDFLEFSPDTKTVVSGSKNSSITIWNPKTGDTLDHPINQEYWAINEATFSSDGTKIATIGLDGSIELLDIQSGKVTSLLEIYHPDVDKWTTDPLASAVISFNPDGDIVAYSLKENSINILDTKSGEIIRTLKGHTQPITSIAFSPNGELLASGSRDETIRLWNVSSGEVVQILKGHSWAVYSMAFDSVGETLAAGSGDGETRIWKVRERSPIYRFIYEFNASEVSGALRFLWELELEEEDLNFVHKPHLPSLNPQMGHHITWTDKTRKYRPLLDMPKDGETKMGQVVRWLEEQCAFKDLEKNKCSGYSSNKRIAQ